MLLPHKRAPPRKYLTPVHAPSKSVNPVPAPTTSKCISRSRPTESRANTHYPVLAQTRPAKLMIPQNPVNIVTHNSAHTLMLIAPRRTRDYLRVRTYKRQVPGSILMCAWVLFLKKHETKQHRRRGRRTQR